MITTKNASILIALSLAACGVKVNGKSYGLGGSSSGGNAASSDSSSSSSSDSSSSSSSDSSSSSSGDAPQYAAAGNQCYQPGTDGDDPKILASPADPWLGVADDQPAVIKRASLVWQEGDCTAQHDHCLRDCAWFAGPATLNEPDRSGPVINQGNGRFRGRSSTASSSLDGKSLYRTVPATKRMLTPGAIVVSVAKNEAVPNDGYETWQIGELERVDWKTEQLYMRGSADPYRLSATRVAVLSWREGGKVEIMNGRKRDQLAVRSDELFLPKTFVAQSDPWSQVKDGQPIFVADTAPFNKVAKCTPANDHCLRPWVWLVDLGGSGQVSPAKWNGKAFEEIEAIDSFKKVGEVTAAYRTVPATKDNLKVGALVFNSGASGEEGAHTYTHETATVIRVRTDGKVEVQGRSNVEKWPIDDVRVPVVVWYPGEKAEAFP